MNPPRALPAWAYSHPEMTRLEYERLLRPSWQIVCHINSIPASGDFVTLDLGPDSVVAVRDSHGEIQVFHNVCRHRGARILDGVGNTQAGSCPGTITCPYHGGSYRLTGELMGVPVRDSFPGLDRAKHSLKPVRMAIQFGFVFVNLAGDPAPLENIWGNFLEDFAAHSFETMQPLGPLYLEHWDVDWKIAMDNYLESYHVPIGHPGLFRMFTPDYDDQANLPGVARGISWLRERPSSQWSERMYQQLIGPLTEDLPELKGWLPESEEDDLSEAKELRGRLEASGMHGEAKEAVLREIRKLERGDISGELATSRNYVNLLLSLPWTAPDVGVQWFTSWEAAKAEAEKTGRPILLVSAAPHCGGVSGIW